MWHPLFDDEEDEEDEEDDAEAEGPEDEAEFPAHEEPLSLDCHGIPGRELVVDGRCAICMQPVDEIASITLTWDQIGISVSYGFLNLLGCRYCRTYRWLLLFSLFFLFLSGFDAPHRVC